jgi:hypothetical protein
VYPELVYGSHTVPTAYQAVCTCFSAFCHGIRNGFSAMPGIFLFQKRPLDHSIKWFLDLRITSLKMPQAFGPMSSPIQPSGMASLGHILVCASAANLSAITLSSGRWMLTPFSVAFFQQVRGCLQTVFLAKGISDLFLPGLS